MKGIALATLAVLNLIALVLSATRFFVTFADVPSRASLRHVPMRITEA
jgi:hypothetical protein